MTALEQNLSPDSGHRATRHRHARARWRVGSLVMLLAVALALAGCGKKGAPQAPDEPNTFPRTYPSG